MAANEEDVFDPLARFRKSAPPAAAAPTKNKFGPLESVPNSQDFDPLARFRHEAPSPEIPRESTTFGEEARVGLGSGIDQMQGSLFGVVGLAGRELGIKWLEDAGNAGAAEQFKQAGELNKSSQAKAFTDIEEAGDFFKWIPNAIGNIIPSLATSMTGAGVGAAIGRKSVELGVKRAVATKVAKDLAKIGFTQEEAMLATRSLMTTKQGQDMIRDTFLNKSRAIDKFKGIAAKEGSKYGAVTAASLPMIGGIDQELVSAGIADPGLTALFGGIAAGALEAVPALRMLDMMFPGVDKGLSKQFVKDFAVATGTQLALEGSTEAAQEMIQLAAHAYHDPSFDMFSPDARDRVINAFAAGALMGAVSGGGAAVVGEVNTNLREGAKIVKKNAPVVAAWTMDSIDKAAQAATYAANNAIDKASEAATNAAPEGFVQADNTLVEEIKSRVYGAVQPRIESIVNSLRNQVQSVTDDIDKNLEGGLNSETASVSQVMKAAHEAFIQKHEPQIKAAKEYMDKQIADIAKTAQDIKSPEGREQFVATKVKAVTERLSGFIDKLRQAAAKRDKNVEAEVDNMQFPDDILDDLNIGYEDVIDETERRVGPSGRKFDRAVGPEPEQGDLQGVSRNGKESANVGEVNAPTVSVWGRNQLKPQFDVNGKETVTPYTTKEDAVLGLRNLRKRFKDAPNRNDTFRIVKHESGKGWIIEAIDPGIRESQKFWNDFQGARDTAAPKANAPAHVKARKYSTTVDGSEFGFTFKNLHLDLLTLAYRGKNLIKDPRKSPNFEEGFLAMSTELLTRGILNIDQFNEMHAKFNELVGKERTVNIDAFTSETQYPRSLKDPKKPDAVAKANMMNFITKLKARGINMPFSLLGTRKNDNGTYSWGVVNFPLFRSLRGNEPATAKAILDGIKHERRGETLAEASRKEGEFSRSPVAEGQSSPRRAELTREQKIRERARQAANPDRTSSGDMADPRGQNAGKPDVDVLGTTTIQEGEANLAERDPKQRDFSEEIGGMGRRGDNIQKTIKVTQETKESVQATDKVTDPKKLPSEFDEPGFDDDVKKRRTRSAKQNQTTGKRRKGQLGPQTAKDEAILKRYAQPGSVKNLLTGPTAKALGELAAFVRKTLGLSNQVIILDETGVQALLDAGHVEGAAFEQAIARGKPASIRLGDNAFIYLPNKVASDPAIAVLALGHEMGHHLYTVAWDNLTEAGKQRLRVAYVKDTKNDFGEKGFNEWMADQLAAWITQRRIPRNKVEAFFAEVAGKIRRLVDYIKNNKRFQLNPTYSEFADAVAQRATTPASQGADPLSDQNTEAWFKNEGVTMYKWFGRALEAKNNPEVDNMDMAFDMQPATAQGRAALANVTSKYPNIVKHAALLKSKTISLYKQALAPSTGVVVDIAKRVPSAMALVHFFSRGVHGEAKQGSNYHQLTTIAKAQFATAYSKLDHLSKERKAEIARSLALKDGDPKAVFDADEQVVRELYDSMHKYATDAGLPVHKITNYFTRSFNQEKLLDNRQMIIDHLTNTRNFTVKKAREIYGFLTDPKAQDGRATFDATETPAFAAMNSRKKGVMADNFFDQFQDDNLDMIISNYVNSVVKRAEFNRKLGEPFQAVRGGVSVREALKTGLWDPKAGMHKILRDAKAENATDEDLKMLEMYIDANLGQLGRDSVKPGTRRLMAGVMAYQNLRVLLFTVFASLPDMVGPAIRANDSSLAWNTLKKHVRDMATDKNKLAATARAYGVISDAANHHIMTEYVDNHYMSPMMRKANDTFFEYTGLNWYTDFTRKYALAVGQDYLVQNAELSKSPDAATAARGKDMLAELGVTAAQVEAWDKAGQPTYDSISADQTGDQQKIAEALVQFVDESIMRPNASQRPLLGSHPALMLVYHLKGYLYAVHATTLKRLAFNIAESKTPRQYVAAIAPAMFMMAFTALGLELRELIQYFGSNRQPPTDRMDGWEYTFELAQRSGLTGLSQLAIDFDGAEDKGMSHIAGIGGPTVSQLYDIATKPTSQTIPKAIPVIGQIPAARALVRSGIQ